MSDNEQRIKALEARVAHLTAQAIVKPSNRGRITTNAQEPSRKRRMQVTKAGSKPGVTWPLAAKIAQAAAEPARKTVAARPAVVKLGYRELAGAPTRKLTHYVGRAGREAASGDEPELATVLNPDVRD